MKYYLLDMHYKAPNVRVYSSLSLSGESIKKMAITGAPLDKVMATANVSSGVRFTDCLWSYANEFIISEKASIKFSSFAIDNNINKIPLTVFKNGKTNNLAYQVWHSIHVYDCLDKQESEIDFIPETKLIRLVRKCVLSRTSIPRGVDLFYQEPNVWIATDNIINAIIGNRLSGFAYNEISLSD